MQHTLPDIVLFKKASWEELRRGEVIFDLSDHDDVQYILTIGNRRRLIKFEDLSTGLLK